MGKLTTKGAKANPRKPGPLVALTIKAGTLLLGETILGVRLPAVLMALGLSWLLFDFCRRFLNQPQLGFWVVVAVNSTTAVRPESQGCFQPCRISMGS